MTAHTVLQRNIHPLNSAYFADGHGQSSQKLNSAEHVHILFRILAITVIFVTCRIQKTLLFIKPDVFFGDIHQLLHLIDSHVSHLHTCMVHVPQRRKSSMFQKNYKRHKNLFYIVFPKRSIYNSY